MRTGCLWAEGRETSLFVKGDVLNLFNQSTLVVPRFINQGVLTNVNRPAVLQAFNPFTETPVEGRALGARPELRHGDLAVRLPGAADVPHVLGVRF